MIFLQVGRVREDEEDFDGFVTQALMVPKGAMTSPFKEVSKALFL